MHVTRDIRESNQFRALYARIHDGTPVGGPFQPAALEDWYAAAGNLRYLWAFDAVYRDNQQALLALALEAGIDKAWLHLRSDDSPSLHMQGRNFDHPIGVQNMQQAHRLADFVKQNGGWDDLVWIGTGGSLFGPQALYQGLAACHGSATRVHWASSFDAPASLQTIRPESRVLVVVVSKSGGTAEVQTMQQQVRDALPAQADWIAVTTPDSALDDTSRYDLVLHMHPRIGGRFSVSTAVGAALVIPLAGIDTYRHFLDGMYEVDQQSERYGMPAASLDAACQLALHGLRDYRSLAFVPYNTSLAGMVTHAQQLHMESLGKRYAAHWQNLDTGLVPPVLFGAVGPEAQHTFYQWLHQGPPNTVVEMLATGSMESAGNVNMLAQAIALYEGEASQDPNKQFAGGVPVSLLWLPDTEPQSLGNLWAFLEHRTVMLGWLLGINPFDQEGVELGKRLARAITANQSGRLQEIQQAVATVFCP